jgi:hypothetical protein
MTANPSKTNDQNIGCSHFLLRLKAKELNVPNDRRKITTLIIPTTSKYTKKIKGYVWYTGMMIT